MVNELRIYFEGDPLLKQGIRAFLTEIVDVARRRRCRIQAIATGATPVQDFHAATKANPDAWNVLLLDSDCSIESSLAELCRTKRLDPKREDSIFWMVQTMESWFLGDINAIKEYYGDGFQENALRGNPDIEKIPKTDVYSRLKRATKGTKPGEYHKTKHAPALLERIDVSLVKAAAPNCERMFRIILGKLTEN